jgi:hypothetical protein
LEVWKERGMTVELRIVIFRYNNFTRNSVMKLVDLQIEICRRMRRYLNEESTDEFGRNLANAYIIVIREE